jgi:hypothetical protein
LILVATITSAETALFALHGRDNPPNSALMIAWLSSISWSWWVHVDRKRCRAGLPFEFDALVFFLWPLTVPYYLIRTRSTRTAGATVLAWGMYALPFVVAFWAVVSSVIR